VVGTIVCPGNSNADHGVEEQLALLCLVNFVQVDFAIVATALFLKARYMTRYLCSGWVHDEKAAV